MGQAASLEGKRLLIVEDEAMVAMLVEDLVTDLGCVVIDVAGTLEQGLALADRASASIDGAILDVNLGGMKVFPIADLLSERGVRFIFASGYGAIGVESRYASYTVLAKPFRRDSLRTALLNALA